MKTNGVRKEVPQDLHKGDELGEEREGIIKTKLNSPDWKVFSKEFIQNFYSISTEIVNSPHFLLRDSSLDKENREGWKLNSRFNLERIKCTRMTNWRRFAEIRHFYR